MTKREVALLQEMGMKLCIPVIARNVSWNDYCVKIDDVPKIVPTFANGKGLETSKYSEASLFLQGIAYGMELFLYRQGELLSEQRKPLPEMVIDKKTERIEYGCNGRN